MIELVKLVVHPFAAVPTRVSVLLIVGTKATPLFIPPDQLYIDAPDPVRVTDVPEQIVEDGDTLILRFGRALTVIVTVLALEQPFDVPVTVYVVVATGVKATPFVTPPVHV